MTSDFSYRSSPAYILLLSLLLLAISIPGHPLHIDEAWIGEQAYFLARDGYVHSALFAEPDGGDAMLILYHRLFVLAGSFAVRIFGWDIWPLRLVTIISGLGLLAAMALYMRRERNRPAEETLLALLFVLLIPITFTHFKIYRPEIMMTLFGFLSYWSLERYEKTSHARYAAASGLLAGLAALTHLYGLMFPICAGIMLLRMRRWAGLGIFAGLAVVPFIPYLLDIAVHQDLFRREITSPIAARKTSFTLATPFLNLLEEHKRLFRTIEIAPVVILFILSLVLNLKRHYRERRLFYEYTILLVLLLGAIAPDKLVTRYAIPLFPFFAMEIAHALRSIFPRGSTSNFIRVPMFLIATIFLGYGLYFQTVTAFDTRENVVAMNERIGTALPDSARCLGPMNLIFNQIERCHIIGLYPAVKEHADNLTLADATAYARARNARYIVLNRLATNEEVIVDLEQEKYPGNDSLAIIAETNEYMVMEIRF